MFQKTRQCVQKLEGQFQTSLRAKSINFLKINIIVMNFEIKKFVGWFEIGFANQLHTDCYVVKYKCPNSHSVQTLKSK